MKFVNQGNIIQSDDGWSVQILGREGLTYFDKEKSIRISSEMLNPRIGSAIAIDSSSIRNWIKDDEIIPIDKNERKKIINNLILAFTSNNITPDIFDSEEIRKEAQSKFKKVNDTLISNIEGWSVELFTDIGVISYKEGNRKIEVKAHGLTAVPPTDILLLGDSANYWIEETKETLLTPKERRDILNNIANALLYDGFKVEVKISKEYM